MRKGEYRRKRKNPVSFLSDKQMGEIAGDLAIERMFGLCGLAISAGSPKLKKVMLDIAIKGGVEIAPGIVVASTNPPSPTAGLANPSTEPETGMSPKEEKSDQPGNQ